MKALAIIGFLAFVICRSLGMKMDISAVTGLLMILIATRMEVKGSGQEAESNNYAAGADTCDNSMDIKKC